MDVNLEMVPSSARATAPSASPLPDQLVPLLQEALDKIKSVISNVLPVSKKRTALEEAEWEDEGEEGAQVADGCTERRGVLLVTAVEDDG